MNYKEICMCTAAQSTVVVKYTTIICDPLRDNPAHPVKINFLLEATIVTKVTFLVKMWSLQQ